MNFKHEDYYYYYRPVCTSTLHAWHNWRICL